jgi:hypothetical protein
MFKARIKTDSQELIELLANFAAKPIQLMAQTLP